DEAGTLGSVGLPCQAARVEAELPCELGDGRRPIGLEIDTSEKAPPAVRAEDRKQVWRLRAHDAPPSSVTDVWTSCLSRARSRTPEVSARWAGASPPRRRTRRSGGPRWRSGRSRPAS